MNAITSRQRKALIQENKAFPAALVKLPRDQWPPGAKGTATLIEAWRSRDFLVQVHRGSVDDIERLSICRTTVRADGRFDDRITWDELQRLKAECGRGDRPAVEVFPPDDALVNVANMRHLWVLPEAPEFMWQKQGSER